MRVFAPCSNERKMIPNDFRREKRWQSFQPQARLLAILMTELIRLNQLTVRRKLNDLHRYRVLDCYARAVRVIELHEQFFRLHRLFQSFGLNLSIDTHPHCARVRHICTRRERDNHVPLHLQEFSRVRQDVPLRMTAGTLLQVTTVRLMASLSERFADFLRLFASDENSQYFSPIPSSQISTMCLQNSTGIRERSMLPLMPCVPVVAPLGALTWHGSPF